MTRGNATTKEGTVRDLTDPLFQEFSYQVPTQSRNKYPTVRLDYQLSSRHRLTWSMNFQYFGGGPDTTNNREAFFPGFPVQANQSSTRRAGSWCAVATSAPQPSPIRRHTRTRKW